MEIGEVGTLNTDAEFLQRHCWNSIRDRYRSSELADRLLDHDYISEIAFGMPPTGGGGIGLERLLMLLCDADSIQEVLWYPHLAVTAVP